MKGSSWIPKKLVSLLEILRGLGVVSQSLVSKSLEEACPSEKTAGNKNPRQTRTLHMLSRRLIAFGMIHLGGSQKR